MSKTFACRFRKLDKLVVTWFSFGSLQLKLYLTEETKTKKKISKRKLVGQGVREISPVSIYMYREVYCGKT